MLEFNHANNVILNYPFNFQISSYFIDSSQMIEMGLKDVTQNVKEIRNTANNLRQLKKCT